MKQFTYIIILGIILITACRKDDIPKSIGEGSPIYLSAVAEGSDVTRTPYEYTVPNDSEDGVLHAAIWASSYRSGTEGNYTYTYPNPNPPLNGKNGIGDTAGQVAIHATADFDSGYPQLLDQAVYPQSGTPVFFVGLHPQTGWESNNEKATFTFDGSQDVMFAPRIEGKYADTSTNDNLVFDVPELKFWHLLTWLKVRMVAEDEDTMKAWGEITSVKITSRNQVNIDISREDDMTEGKINLGCITYMDSGNNGLLPLRAVGSNDVFPSSSGYQLKYIQYGDNIKNHEVAYVLCSPVIAVESTVEDGKDVTVPEYTLHIETKNRKIELPIDLMRNDTNFYIGDTRAKCFTLNLTFKMGNTIVVTAEVEDWKLGGTGFVEL